MDKGAFVVLKAELEECEKDVCHIYERIHQRETTFRETTEGIDSMAYQIHNLYGTYEQLFETVAQFFENRIEGERYHTDLLRRMKLSIEGIRPALVSDEAFSLLDELRRFRHFFRHAYTAELKPEQVGEVVAMALQLKDVFQRDWEAFLAKLNP
ncbi:hypothetical protein FJZ31_03085 [Candidatus Poribacteria bacterium]|nr:hypothetical protein [Candidatus Poribacteria bacterium]